MKKKSNKKIEKEIKKVEKKIKRNWKKIIIITILSVLIISFLLFITGLKVRFALTDTLIINLEPSEKSFRVDNRQSQNLTFSISSYNSRFCTAECTYAFYDRSEAKILDNGSMTMTRETEINKTYAIDPPAHGRGQKIFNFDVQCSNIRSFLCSTKSPVTRKSSFITLNYELTEEETIIKNELHEKIRGNMGLLNNASDNLQKSKYLLNNSQIIGINRLLTEYNSIKHSLEDNIKKVNVILDLWTKEQYITIDVIHLKDWLINSEKNAKKSNNLFNLLSSSIDIQSKDINKYNSLKKLFSETAEKSFILNSTSKFYPAYESTRLIHEKSINSNYSYASDFTNDVESMSSLIIDFNKTILRKYGNITYEGQQLASMEYSKKCKIGYCENLTGDECIDLKNILIEYQNATYIIQSGMNLSSDYIVNGNNAKIKTSSTSQTYHQTYCEFDKSSMPEDIADLPKLILPDLSNITITKAISNELTENPPLCCVYGECLPCCNDIECKEDPKLFPLILIHGHSLVRKKTAEPSLNILNKIEYQLQDEGFINTGTIRFDFYAGEYSGDWGLSNSPIVVKASYYYDYFYSVGKYIYITRNSDNIDTYAVRLNDIIELIRSKTGKPKVNIIAHSMGGLVARRYMQIFGDDKVYKATLIGTPNKGIEGTVKKYCNVFGEKRECEDMYVDSILMKKLNDPYYKTTSVQIFTISGKGCDTNGNTGDGVVVFKNSLIPYATSYVVNGTCEDVFNSEMHNDLTNIDKYPEVYEYISEILDIPKD